MAIDLAIFHLAEMKIPQTGGKVVPIKKTEPADKRPEPTPLLVMNDYVFLKQGFKFIKLRVTDLLYAESENNYVYIITRTQKFSLRMSMSELLDLIHFPSLL